MEFYKLLGMAESKQKEKSCSSSEGKFLSTKIAPARKDPKQKKLSENVKKFMQSKTEEQVSKEKDAEEKRKKLLQLRSENKKSQRTMKAMLHMTKSADKSAVSDASASMKLNNGLSREQCDEDDYGYESNAARAFFEKLMTKFEKTVEDPMDKFTKSGNKRKVTNLVETKNRVLGKLQNGEDKDEHSSSSNRNKPSSKDANGEMSSRKSEGSSLTHPSSKLSNGAKKPKLKPMMPPTSYTELIRLAEEAKKKPIEFKPKPNLKDYEFDRPMTSKEKQDFLNERASNARKACLKPGQALKSALQGGDKPSPASSKLNKIVKLPSDKGEGVSSRPTSSQLSSSKNVNSTKGQSVVNSNNNKLLHSSNNKLLGKASDAKPEKLLEGKKKPKVVGPEFHPAVVKIKEKIQAKQSSSSSSSKYENSKKSSLPSRPDSLMKSSDRSRQLSPQHLKGKRSHSESRSPSPEIRRRSEKSKRQRIDSESEYDSEMDDFIDDTEANIDISAEIRNIFGYDRRKFRNEADFDDRSMECNRFADVMREEARSAKIGRMEDLEDMRREEEEKRRKSLMKKKKR